MINLYKISIFFYRNARLDRINEVVVSVTPAMLAHVWKEIEFRLDVFRAINGPAHGRHG